MDVSVIIVNYNSGELLSQCLSSLQSLFSTVLTEIIVVDNASTDESIHNLGSHASCITLIKNRCNVGFGPAVNVGYRNTSGRYILILNPDVDVGPSSIEMLVEYMKVHGDVALSAPKLLNPDGTLQYSCRTYYTLPTVLLRRTFLGRLWPDHPAVRQHLMINWDHRHSRDVDWVLGASMMVRREAIGGNDIMDERFFLYFEDVDLCIRLRKAGWRIVYNPAAVMTHHHQRASAAGHINRAKYEHFKSWLKFLWKYRHESFAPHSHAVSAHE
jgi:GT2 family glycosyltransferase